MEETKMLNLTQTLAAFFANSPRKIEGAEIDGWCGLEGDGYIANPDENTSIVMDVTDGEVQIELHNHFTDEIKMWSLKATEITF
jgi:hypothetical protein